MVFVGLRVVRLSMMETLAHYNRWRAWVAVAFLSLWILAIPVLTYLLFKKIQSGWQYHAYAVTCCITCWVSIIPLSRLLFSIVRQLVFHDARLLWVEKDMLVWQDVSNFSVRCSDVEKVIDGFGGDFGQFDTLVFKMRDGSDKAITTAMMRETASDIARQLSEIIHSQCPSASAQTA
jgi:hypothetical protein